MGDMLSLIERAEEVVDREQAEELARKIRRSEFTLDDYRDQLKQLRKMGPLEQVLSMLPGMGAVKDVDVDAGEREMQFAQARKLMKQLGGSGGALKRLAGRLPQFR
jgi:signal recognition particle subunit SRP54